MRNIKKIALFLTISLELLSVKCFSNDKFVNGNQSFGKESFDNIQANGNTTLHGTKISHLFSANGYLKAEDASFGNLQVNGEVDLKNCTISNQTKINGSLNAVDTTFKNNLSIASKKIIFDNCLLESVIVRKINGYEGNQVIELRNSTTVAGSIVFESGNGEIWLAPTSKIKGKVEGSKVVDK